jgi:hypothetical protein
LKKEKKKNFQFQKRKKGKFYFFQKRKKKRAVFIKREKENTPEDFSDNIHNIKKFVQVDLSEKITKKPSHFSYFPLPENASIALLSPVDVRFF